MAVKTGGERERDIHLYHMSRQRETDRQTDRETGRDRDRHTREIACIKITYKVAVLTYRAMVL